MVKLWIFIYFLFDKGLVINWILKYLFVVIINILIILLIKFFFILFVDKKEVEILEIIEDVLLLKI